MANNSKQIVCISTHYWDDAWFRKQQFMSRFVENGFKVAYIEPSFSMAKRPDEFKKNYQTNRPFKVVVEKRNESLFILKPPRGIPFLSRPQVSRLNYIYFSLKLKYALKKLGFRNYILWVYRPEYAPGIRYLDYTKLVVGIVDDLAAYKQDEPRKYQYTNECVNDLVKNSDLVVVTAATLYDKYKAAAKTISLVPNGFDLDMFSGNSINVPEDISKIASPIIGFIGTLFSFLDYALLENVIQNSPEKSFVFIGVLEDNSKTEWERITTYENVFWLGKKKKEDIPAYLNSFDVCINPFKVDDVSRSVSPLKVFEYLAAKKPVVSVRMESLEKEEVAPYIYFASSYQEFHDKLNEALLEKESFSEKLDSEMVAKYSWDNLFQKVLESVKGI